MLLSTYKCCARKSVATFSWTQKGVATRPYESMAPNIAPSQHALSEEMTAVGHLTPGSTNHMIRVLTAWKLDPLTPDAKSFPVSLKPPQQYPSRASSCPTCKTLSRWPAGTFSRCVFTKADDPARPESTSTSTSQQDPGSSKRHILQRKRTKWTCLRSMLQLRRERTRYDMVSMQILLSQLLRRFAFGQRMKNAGEGMSP